jgi:hypothetical protein
MLSPASKPGINEIEARRDDDIFVLAAKKSKLVKGTANDSPWLR